jgi:hypothetical protein
LEFGAVKEEYRMIKTKIWVRHRHSEHLALFFTGSLMGSPPNAPTRLVSKVKTTLSEFLSLFKVEVIAALTCMYMYL